MEMIYAVRALIYLHILNRKKDQLFVSFIIDKMKILLQYFYYQQFIEHVSYNALYFVNNRKYLIIFQTYFAEYAIYSTYFIKMGVLFCVHLFP